MSVTRNRSSAPPHANAAPSVHPLIRRRASSARVFAPRAIEPRVLGALFEAARWAPSSFNEQPWRFLVATPQEPEWLARMQRYLEEGNTWARAAPVLVASAYRTRFSRSEAPNPMALRDLGAAEQNLLLQAVALGLAIRQIAGFDKERLQRELLPEGFEPGTLTALGYPLESGAESQARRRRERRSLDEFVFGSRWGQPAFLLPGKESTSSA